MKIKKIQKEVNYLRPQIENYVGGISDQRYVDFKNKLIDFKTNVEATRAFLKDTKLLKESLLNEIAYCLSTLENRVNKVDTSQLVLEKMKHDLDHIKNELENYRGKGKDEKYYDFKARLHELSRKLQIIETHEKEYVQNQIESYLKVLEYRVNTRKSLENLNVVKPKLQRKNSDGNLSFQTVFDSLEIKFANLLDKINESIKNENLKQLNNLEIEILNEYANLELMMVKNDKDYEDKRQRMFKYLIMLNKKVTNAKNSIKDNEENVNKLDKIQYELETLQDDLQEYKSKNYVTVSQSNLLKKHLRGIEFGFDQIEENSDKIKEIKRKLLETITEVHSSIKLLKVQELSAPKQSLLKQEIYKQKQSEKIEELSEPEQLLKKDEITEQIQYLKNEDIPEQKQFLKKEEIIEQIPSLEKVEIVEHKQSLEKEYLFKEKQLLRDREILEQKVIEDIIPKQENVQNIEQIVCLRNNKHYKSSDVGTTTDEECYSERNSRDSLDGSLSIKVKHFKLLWKEISNELFKEESNQEVSEDILEILRDIKNEIMAKTKYRPRSIIKSPNSRPTSSDYSKSLSPLQKFTSSEDISTKKPPTYQIKTHPLETGKSLEELSKARNNAYVPVYGSDLNLTSSRWKNTFDPPKKIIVNEYVNRFTLGLPHKINENNKSANHSFKPLDKIGQENKDTIIEESQSKSKIDGKLEQNEKSKLFIFDENLSFEESEAGIKKTKNLNNRVFINDGRVLSPLITLKSETEEPLKQENKHFEKNDQLVQELDDLALPHSQKNQSDLSKEEILEIQNLKSELSNIFKEDKEESTDENKTSQETNPFKNDSSTESLINKSYFLNIRHFMDIDKEDNSQEEGSENEEELSKNKMNRERKSNGSTDELKNEENDNNFKSNRNINEEHNIISEENKIVIEENTNVVDGNTVKNIDNLNHKENKLTHDEDLGIEFNHEPFVEIQHVLPPNSRIKKILSEVVELSSKILEFNGYQNDVHYNAIEDFLVGKLIELENIAFSDDDNESRFLHAEACESIKKYLNILDERATEQFAISDTDDGGTPL